MGSDSQQPIPLPFSVSEDIASYRLSQVELTVASMDRKLDNFIEKMAVVDNLRYRIEVIEKRNDRLLAFASTLGVGLLILAFQVVFGK